MIIYNIKTISHPPKNTSNNSLSIDFTDIFRGNKIEKLFKKLYFVIAKKPKFTLKTV